MGFLHSSIFSSIFIFVLLAALRCGWAARPGLPGLAALFHTPAGAVNDFLPTENGLGPAEPILFSYGTTKLK